MPKLALFFTALTLLPLPQRVVAQPESRRFGVVCERIEPKKLKVDNSRITMIEVCWDGENPPVLAGARMETK